MHKWLNENLYCEHEGDVHFEGWLHYVKAHLCSKSVINRVMSVWRRVLSVCYKSVYLILFYFLTWMVTTWVFFSNYTHSLCTLPCVWYIFHFKKFPPKKVKWPNILKPLIQWEVLFRYSLSITLFSPVIWFLCFSKDHLKW